MSTRRPSTPLGLFWSEFRENRVALAALAVVVVIVVLALAAPLIAPQDPYDLANLNLADARRPPGFVGEGGYVHRLGTDSQGATCFPRSSTACASPWRWGSWRGASD